MKSKRKPTIYKSAMLPVDLADAIKTLAEEEDRTFSAMMKILLAEGLKHYK